MGLIRLFLAAVVAVDHIRAILLRGTPASPDSWITGPQLGLNAGYAVLYFYVISGFLISYALTHKYHGRLAAYATSRFVRIFSLYWPLYAISAFLAAPTAPWWQHVSALVLLGSDWIVAFGHYPQQYFGLFPPYINQAWTLGAEVTFYVLAPIFLRSVRASALLFALSLAVRLPLTKTIGYSETWSLHFFPATLWLFLLGHLSRVGWDRFKPPAWSGVALVAASAAVSLAAATHGGFWDDGYFYAALFLFGAGLPGVFELTKDRAWMNWCGDLSYPLYLTHILTIGLLLVWTGADVVLIRADRGPLPGLLVLAVYAAAAGGVALMASLALERPTAWAMRAAIRLAASRHAPRPPLGALSDVGVGSEHD